MVEIHMADSLVQSPGIDEYRVRNEWMRVTISPKSDPRGL